MKKTLFLLLVCLFGSLSINAQSEKVFVYGIDFSPVKVYGTDEPVEQFAEAFKNINYLLITEREKYDFSKMLKAKVVVDIETVMNKLSASDYSDMKVWNTDYADVDCASIVQNYALRQTEGTGVVLIAKILNKGVKKAVYELVLFDIATREILLQEEVVGEAGGFGLRNFWAASVYNVIENVRIRVAQ